MCAFPKPPTRYVTQHTSMMAIAMCVFFFFLISFHRLLFQLCEKSIDGYFQCWGFFFYFIQINKHTVVKEYNGTLSVYFCFVRLVRFLLYYIYVVVVFFCIECFQKKSNIGLLRTVQRPWAIIYAVRHAFIYLTIHTHTLYIHLYVYKMFVIFFPQTVLNIYELNKGHGGLLILDLVGKIIRNKQLEMKDGVCMFMFRFSSSFLFHCRFFLYIFM